MKYKHLFLITILILGSGWAAASKAADESEMITAEATGVETGIFAEEGLSDNEIATEGIEDEKLPVDGMSYRWERLKAGFHRSLTLNVDKKAALDRELLHRLDRKLTACAAISDTQCLEKVQADIERVKARHEELVTKQGQASDSYWQRFEEWRGKREFRIDALREYTKAQASRQSTSGESFRSNRPTAGTKQAVQPNPNLNRGTQLQAQTGTTPGRGADGLTNLERHEMRRQEFEQANRTPAPGEPLTAAQQQRQQAFQQQIDQARQRVKQWSACPLPQPNATLTTPEARQQHATAARAALEQCRQRSLQQVNAWTNQQAQQNLDRINSFGPAGPQGRRGVDPKRGCVWSDTGCR